MRADSPPPSPRLPLPLIVTTQNDAPPDNAPPSPTLSPAKSSERRENLVRSSRRRSQKYTNQTIRKRIRTVLDRALQEAPNSVDAKARQKALDALHAMEEEYSAKPPQMAVDHLAMNKALRTIKKHQTALGLDDRGASSISPGPAGLIVSKLSPRRLDDLVKALCKSPVDWGAVDKLAQKLGAELAPLLKELSPDARHEFLCRTDTPLHRHLSARLRALALPQPGDSPAPSPRSSTNKRKSLVFSPRKGTLSSPEKKSKNPDVKPVTLDNIGRAVALITRHAGEPMGNFVIKSGTAPKQPYLGAIPLVARVMDAATGKSTQIELESHLGAGAYAHAYRYRATQNPDLRLVGKVAKGDSQDEGPNSIMHTAGYMHEVQQATDREVRMHMEVMRDEPANVVGLVGVLPNEKGMGMPVLEYMANGEVGTLSELTLGSPAKLAEIKSKVSMSTQTFDAHVASAKRTLARDMLDGINQIHLAGVSHNDISRSNVFISSAGVAKVADFGNARLNTLMRLNAFGECLTQMHGAYPLQHLRRAVYRENALRKLDASILAAQTSGDTARAERLRVRRLTLVHQLDPTATAVDNPPPGFKKPVFQGVGKVTPNPTDEVMEKWAGMDMPYTMDSRAPDYWNAAMAIYDIFAPMKNPLIYRTVNGTVRSTTLEGFVARSEQLAAAADDEARQAILFEGVTLEEVPQDIRDLIASMLSFDGSLPEYGKQLEYIQQSQAYGNTTDRAARNKLVQGEMMPGSLLQEDVGSDQTRQFITQVLCDPKPAQQ